MGDRRGAYRVLVGTTEGKRPLGRSRRRCEDNIKMGVVDWIDLALIRRQVADACECGNKLTGSVKCGEFPD
jgi:hypothetical protein